MLILTRRMGEGIMIGDDIFLTILGFSGNQVKIGLCAPESVSIYRDEIYQKNYLEKTHGNFTDFINYKMENHYEVS